MNFWQKIFQKMQNYRHFVVHSDKSEFIESTERDSESQGCATCAWMIGSNLDI